MWKLYSAASMKKNRAASFSIGAAALIASVFLSLIYSMSYNIWKYDVEQILEKEGSWQGRLVGEISDEEAALIQNHGNVTKISVYTDQDGQMVTDLWFEHRKDAYQDMPEIAAWAGISPAGTFVHTSLLSQYLIFDPEEKEQPLSLRFFLAVMLLAGISLILIIQNAFAASMQARIHQLGILSSIGATPWQIRTCLLQEAMLLCAGPVLLGSAGGIGLSMVFVWYLNHLGERIQNHTAASFWYHPWIGVLTILISALTLFLAAWFPARKMSRKTPLEAIRFTEEPEPKGKRRLFPQFHVLGMEGELAGNSLRARKRALRLSFFSLTCSFLAFALFSSFMALSKLSVKETYFERYQDAWDVMATIKEERISDFSELAAIKTLDGVKDCTAYQKAVSYTVVKKEAISEELKKTGDKKIGDAGTAGSSLQDQGDAWLLKVSMLVLDDGEFLKYCQQIGAEPGLDGSILWNCIWDSQNSNFRQKKYIPFLEETGEDLILMEETGRKLLGRSKILAYTKGELPNLREEYEDFTLVQILPASLWKQMEESFRNEKRDLYLRILAWDESQILQLEEKVKETLAGLYEIETENRIQELKSNEEIWQGYEIAVSIICGLLAVIGISNVFSETLGFMYQRKREFARYLSIGMTPGGIWKILWIEAAVIAGRPVLITIPLTAAFTVFALRESCLPMTEFPAVFPAVSLLKFISLIFLAVGFAYYLGGKQLKRCELGEVLKDDAMI